MDKRASRPSGAVRQERSTVSARTHRVNKLRGGYLVTSLILVALYPLLPTAGRNTVFLLASFGALAAVVAALSWINPGHRRFWLLLLAALVATDIANVISLSARGTAVSVNGPADAVGNVLFLAAALVLVLQQGRDNLGSIVDTSIGALALAGVLWDLILRPNLLADYQAGSAKLALCVLVFALCGVLGALGQLVIQRPVAALGPLIAAIALGLTGTLIVAVTTDQLLTTATGMMFIGSYTAISLFSLDPTASQLLTPAPMRTDTLSLGRLVFLGLAVGIVPVVVGGQQITGGIEDGLVLVVSGVTVTTLVMVRIGQLSAQRDRAEQALRHDAGHDALTGLPNRKEFVAQLGDALERSGRSSILFCDLDRFKAVNDGFGHEHGDEVLIEVAQRLRECVRADDLVSRFGGDEFVILFRNSTPDEVQTINRRIIHALSRPVSVSGASITIGVSTGAAHANNDTDPDELISRADHAMYTAKNSDA